MPEPAGSSDSGDVVTPLHPVPSQRGDSSEVPVRTFLIADVRGYTRYTQEQGDEAAGALAAAFAQQARDTVTAAGGELLELRGDEALCVFSSARQAMRAAVDLQLAFRRAPDVGPPFPLPIGIGLDAGEAVPVEGGYRGGALNTAARLCGLAGPGQIFATQTVTSLARRIDGIRVVERKRVRLKGLEKPIQIIEVMPDGGLPPLPVAQPKPRSRINRHARLGLGAGAVVGAAVVGLLIVQSRGGPELTAVSANSLGVLDADAAQIRSQITLDSPPSALVRGGGFLWAASEQAETVSRYDTELGHVRTITIGGRVGGLAHGAGSLWATNTEERAVVQIDDRTAKVVQTIEVGNGPGPVVVGRDAVWVVNTVDGTVSRIGLADGAVSDTVPVGAAPAAIAASADAVWVAVSATNSVVRIDPSTRDVVEAVSVGNAPSGLAVAAGAVWVTNRQDATVSRIDAGTNAVTDTVPVGQRPTAVIADRESIWVANTGSGSVSRIGVRDRDVTATVPVTSTPSGLAAADGRVWMTTLPSVDSRRGGVVRVSSTPLECDCLDPVAWNGDVVAPLLYDGLVGYRRVGGVAGGTLVPNLAVGLPQPKDAGRTYEFRLRKGLRYSDGSPVLASHFRQGMERLFAESPYYPSMIGVMGGERCRLDQPCDLSSGIVTDDASGEITLRLRKPDPDLLHVLAHVAMAFAPPAAGSDVLPGTGPYRVAEFDPARQVRLVRNEHFRIWSADARPDGYPDEILVSFEEESTARLRAVESGTSDWVVLDSTPEAKQVPGLLARHADRLHSDPRMLTLWALPNTAIRPFNDHRARQALAFALDRAALAGSDGRVTCQILPPTFPGYRPYCPYTTSPNAAGTWIGPDLTRARALVAASGTAGMRVDVLTFDNAEAVGWARGVAAALQRIGYRSAPRVMSFEQVMALGDSGESARTVPITVVGWVADTLSASNFLRPVFGCNAEMQPLPLCDRALDAKIAEATELQATDPVAASELWAALDRRVVDAGYAVPWANVRNTVLVSERVGNYESHPFWGTLLDQMWVQ